MMPHLLNDRVRIYEEWGDLGIDGSAKNGQTSKSVDCFRPFSCLPSWD